MQIKCISADEKLVDKIIELNKHYYDLTHHLNTKMYLQWLYLHNPNGNARLVIVEENNCYIGIMALIPLKLSTNGNIVDAYFCSNVLTHPDHRKKNLFIKMIDVAKAHCIERRCILLGHPNRSALPAWKRKKMNFREPLKTYLCKYQNILSVRTSKVYDVNDLKGLPFYEWEKSNFNKVQVHNTSEFLKWRYIDCPVHKYEIRIIKRKNEVIGINVIRKYKFIFSLMVHFSASKSFMESVVKSNKPTLLLLDEKSCLAEKSWRVPVDKEIPIFLTDWNNAISDMEFDLLTLAASDL